MILAAVALCLGERGHFPWFRTGRVWRSGAAGYWLLGRSQMSGESSGRAGSSGASRPAFPVRARRLLKVRAVWISPLILGSVVVVLITAFYVGSVVDPVANLHGLPVGLVNQDRGVTIGAKRVNIGHEVQRGLSESTVVSGKLALADTTLSSAEQAMSRGASYATVLIPPGFTAALLNLAGVTASGPGSGKPEIVILTNQRAGTVGVSLATGVLQPGLAAASHRIGRQLTAFLPARMSSPLTRAFLANPVAVTTVEYRPLPSHSALGLSAFYIALLTLMCGFLGGIIVNSSVDAATGYATTEIGPRWRQRQPLPINRWNTLIIKWVMAAVLTGLMTGLMLLVAAGILRMDAPQLALLWLVAWLASASVAAGTIVLFAVLGASIGQLVAMLLFVYAGLATAGGTVPLQALPGALQPLAQIEPLRQILAGTRAILYFNAQADAGLARAVTAAALGLVIWLVLGAGLVRWYDRKGFNRIDPELLAYVSGSVKQYKSRNPGTRSQGSGSAERQTKPGAQD
jgi:YhgE/Pip-like protein